MQKELLAASLPFWKDLTDLQQKDVISNTQIIHYKKGQTLPFQEQECIGIMAILHGRIRVYISSLEGREITLYRMEDKDVCVLSASCVLQSIDFDIHIDAEEDCDILLLSSVTFAKLMEENIHVELFSYKMVSERFSDVMWAMQQILFMSFDKRLASFLLEEVTRNKTNELMITHEQIARHLGSAREVVSRMLKYFEKEGYLILSRGTITILEKRGLQSLLK